MLKEGLHPFIDPHNFLHPDLRLATEVSRQTDRILAQPGISPWDARAQTHQTDQNLVARSAEVYDTYGPDEELASLVGLKPEEIMAVFTASPSQVENQTTGQPTMKELDTPTYDRIIAEQRQAKTGGIELPTWVGPKEQAGSSLILGGAVLAAVLYASGDRLARKNPKLSRLGKGLKVAGLSLLVLGGGAGAAVLAGCDLETVLVAPGLTEEAPQATGQEPVTPTETEPTTSISPIETPIPTETAIPTQPATPTIEVKPGDTINAGGEELIAHEFSVEDLDDLIDLRSRGWAIFATPDNKVKSYLGPVVEGSEKQPAIVLIDPQGFTLNEEGMVLISEDGKTALVPDVILPRVGSNDYGNPALVFRIQDSENRIHNVVIYEKDQWPEGFQPGVQIEQLADGKGMFVGPARDMAITPYDKFTRDSKNNLTWTRLDGSVYRIVTSYSGIESSADLDKLGLWVEVEKERFITPAGTEIINGESKYPERIDAAIQWALERAVQLKGDGNQMVLEINKGEGTMVVTPETKVIIEVVSRGSKAAYLAYSNTLHFGYYQIKDGGLLIKVSANAPRALLYSLLALSLPNEEYIFVPEEERIGYHTINPHIWPAKETIMPFLDLFFFGNNLDEQRQNIEDLLRSPDSRVVVWE